MRLFSSVFQSLPVAYLINDKVMVMHGGLPMKDGVILDDIRKLTRTQEPGEQGKITILRGC
jgi:serine/threonine-protein phosphatase 5